MNGTEKEADDQRVTLDGALKMAVESLQEGQIDRAEYILSEILKAFPDNASAAEFMGITRYRQGKEDEALALLKRATTLAPDAPGVFMNYGNVLVETAHFDDAIDAYTRLLQLAPESAAGWNNMGVLLRSKRRFDLAEEALRKALELNPDDAAAHHNLGNLLLAAGRIEESVKCGLRALTLLDDPNVGRKLLGLAYGMLGETEKAIEVYKDWLAEEPGNATAEHHLAALQGKTPERASDAYVESVFDNFAASFDSKLASLEYRAPELVKDAVLREIGPDAQTDILDLGCGTGLCGPLLRANASRMVGVDLSGKMLAKAQDRKVYDALEKAEFIAFLESVTQPFGAVIAADALCYIGPVEAFAQNTLAALKPGGVFVGSFEADPDDADVTLTNTGRYTHGRPYLARVFNDAGFEAVTLTAETLRFEQGKEVAGWLVSARRPQ